MDEETLNSSISTYKQQLEQVETVLLSAGSEGQTELLKLREDLQEVIQLTQESLLSLKKSQLLSFVDDAASAANSLTSPESSSRIRPSQTVSPNGGSRDRFDEEFAAFQAAIAADDDLSDSQLGSMTSDRPTGGPRCRGQMGVSETGVDIDDDDDDDGDGGDEDDITGTKCSVDHAEEWGGKQRHNAVVLCVEPRGDIREEASLRVLFCNPTSTSMKPCPYYLEGTCRFSAEDCRFSHGYVVKLSELHAFKEPDFSLLKLEAPCLARYSDGVWYPASVQHIDEERHQVVVQYESYGTTSAIDLESVLPSEQHGDASPSLSSSSDDDDDNDDDGSSAPSRRATDEEEEEEEELPSVAWQPSGGGVRLGEWEAHTRGIGSKLMAKMGYEVGKGLGRHGEGRVEPVEAVIVPQGKSLDKCMELRELKKLGIVGKTKKKKKKRTKGKGHHAGGSAPANGQQRKREDVFDFLNRKLGSKRTKITELIQLSKGGRNVLEKDSTQGVGEEKPSRRLNIQLVQTQEDIRSAEKQLVRLRESLHRNQRDKLTASQIQGKIDRTERLLHNLRSSEKTIQRQQNSRHQHRKLTVF